MTPLGGSAVVPVGSGPTRAATARLRSCCSTASVMNCLMVMPWTAAKALARRKVMSGSSMLVFTGPYSHIYRISIIQVFGLTGPALSRAAKKSLGCKIFRAFEDGPYSWWL